MGEFKPHPELDQDPCSFESFDLHGDCWRVLVHGTPGVVVTRWAGEYHNLSPAAARTVALNLLHAASEAEFLLRLEAERSERRG